MMRRNASLGILMVISLLVGSIGAASAQSPSNSLAVSSTSANHPIAGCPPAVHKGPWKVPADGGSSTKTFTGPYILHLWWNNGNPSVTDKWWNHGVPPWGQDLIKVKVPAGVKVKIYGSGGEGWDYQNNRACSHNLRFEFRHGRSIPIKSIDTLVKYGLAKRLN